MTRHGKNCTAGMVYTYQERKKDARQSGYGTDKIRTSKDSIKDFDCCCLTLQPCQNPVITTDGYLYDKEAILEYIITKKNEISRKMKQYEKEKKQEQLELEELAAAEQRSQLRKFEGQESSIISKSDTSSAGPSSESGSVSNMTSDKAKKLPSFWIPSLTPAAKKSCVKKPDKTVHCPMSGRPLRVKDLIPVVFTPVNDPDDRAALISKRNRFMCRVTHDILGNSVPAAVLRPTVFVVTLPHSRMRSLCIDAVIDPRIIPRPEKYLVLMLKDTSCSSRCASTGTATSISTGAHPPFFSGDVVTMECVEKLIKKDMRHPVTGEPLTDTDIIPMQRGGTGFSGANEQLSTSGARPVMQV